jgi:hypothetical protein
MLATISGFRLRASLQWFVRHPEPSFVRRSVPLHLAVRVTLASTVLGTMAALFTIRHARRIRDALRLCSAPLRLQASDDRGVIFFTPPASAAGMRPLFIGHTLVDPTSS